MNTLLEADIKAVRAAGYVVIKQESYRRAQERQRIAEALLAHAEDDKEGAYVWARNCCDEERRIRDRLTFVYGVARAHGATVEELGGSIHPPVAAPLSETPQIEATNALDRERFDHIDPKDFYGETPQQPKHTLPTTQADRRRRILAEYESPNLEYPQVVHSLDCGAVDGQCVIGCQCACHSRLPRCPTHGLTNCSPLLNGCYYFTNSGVGIPQTTATEEQK